MSQKMPKKLSHETRLDNQNKLSFQFEGCALYNLIP